MLNHVQKRITVIAFFLGLNIVLGAYFLSVVRLDIPRPMAEIFYRLGIAPNAATNVDEVAHPLYEEPNLDPEKIVAEINEYRQATDVEPVAQNPELTAAAVTLLQVAAENEYDTDSNFESGALEKALEDAGYSYEWVSHNALVGPLTAEGVMTAWVSDENESEALLNADFTDVGIATDIVNDPNNGRMGVVIQLLGKRRNSTANQVPAVTQQTNEPEPVREIPDNEVIEAINTYRGVHGRSAYSVNEHLCTYAEKRAQDLVAYGGLDGHEGFRNDFADPENPPPGIVEYPKGRKIGENLAHQHCKNMTTGESFVAETGTALIEWCFDSSTKGHREAQLSTEFKNVCVRHADKMYVVIFGE